MGALVLAINPGSSSHEYGLYDEHTCIIKAYYESTADGFTRTIWRGDDQSAEAVSSEVFEAALADFLALAPEAPEAVGLRLVVPGREFMSHQAITPQLEGTLAEAASTSPLHLTAELAELRQVRELLGDVKAYAISDSAFHATLSHEARNYAIPRSDAERFDVYRYGYHGISLQSVLRLLGDDTASRLIVCHLGSGASITAIKDGKSVDTSMGYSPLEGLVMATRSGSIDVEAALQLRRQLELDDEGLVEYLNKKSGLLGLSERSNDIRELLKHESDDVNAKLALNSMVYRIVQTIGAYQASLGGLDQLVFTATVGERSGIIRSRICERIAHLGVQLDTSVNDQEISSHITISSADSAVQVLVIPNDETAEIAAQTRRLMTQ